MLRPSTSRRLSRSESCSALSSRDLSFMRQPSRTLLFRSHSSFRPRSSSRISWILVFPLWMPERISSVRPSCSWISRSRRSFCSMLLLQLAFNTAMADSHSETRPSAAERRSLACSLSISWRCIRSVKLPEEEYRASSSLLACSRLALAWSYSKRTASAWERSLSRVAIQAEISITRSSSRKTR